MSVRGDDAYLRVVRNSDGLRVRLEIPSTPPLAIGKPKKFCIVYQCHNKQDEHLYDDESAAADEIGRGGAGRIDSTVSITKVHDFVWETKNLLSSRWHFCNFDQCFGRR